VSKAKLGTAEKQSHKIGMHSGIYLLIAQPRQKKAQKAKMKNLSMAVLSL